MEVTENGVQAVSDQLEAQVEATVQEVITPEVETAEVETAAVNIQLVDFTLIQAELEKFITLSSEHPEIAEAQRLQALANTSLARSLSTFTLLLSGASQEDLKDHLASYDLPFESVAEAEAAPVVEEAAEEAAPVVEEAAEVAAEVAAEEAAAPVVEQAAAEAAPVVEEAAEVAAEEAAAPVVEQAAPEIEIFMIDSATPVEAGAPLLSAFNNSIQEALQEVAPAMDALVTEEVTSAPAALSLTQ